MRLILVRARGRYNKQSQQSARKNPAHCGNCKPKSIFIAVYVLGKAYLAVQCTSLVALPCQGHRSSREKIQHRAVRLALRQKRGDMSYEDEKRRVFLSITECYKFVFGLNGLYFHDFLDQVYFSS